MTPKTKRMTGNLKQAQPGSRAAMLALELNIMIKSGDLVAIVTNDPQAPDGARFLAVATDDGNGLIFLAKTPSIPGTPGKRHVCLN